MPRSSERRSQQGEPGRGVNAWRLAQTAQPRYRACGGGGGGGGGLSLQSVPTSVLPPIMLVLTHAPRARTHAVKHEMRNVLARNNNNNNTSVAHCRGDS